MYLCVFLVVADRSEPASHLCFALLTVDDLGGDDFGGRLDAGAEALGLRHDHLVMGRDAVMMAGLAPGTACSVFSP